MIFKRLQSTSPGRKRIFVRLGRRRRMIGKFVEIPRPSNPLSSVTACRLRILRVRFTCVEITADRRHSCYTTPATAPARTRSSWTIFQTCPTMVWMKKIKTIIAVRKNRRIIRSQYVSGRTKCITHDAIVSSKLGARVTRRNDGRPRPTVEHWR